MTDRLALTLPESSAASSVEAHPRPGDIPATFDLELNVPYPAGQPTSDAFRSRPGETPLSIWYQRNDGPWIPQGLTSGQDSARASPIVPNLRGNALAFSAQCRDSIVPSECDTVPPGVIPSDSGYASYHPRQSIANGSVCDDSFDRTQETSNLVGHNVGSVPFSPFSQKDDVSHGNTWPQPQPHAAERQIPVATIPPCETCRRPLKTESERKKHNQRHTKPYKCPMEDCRRHEEGFSTMNDLDRHKRSVHPSEKAAGNRYRCHRGHCKNKDKIWPRADNFKAHLKRVHHEENVSEESLEEYIYRYPDPPYNVVREEIPSNLGQYGTFPTEQSVYQPDFWDCPQNTNFGISNESGVTEHPSRTQMDETSTFPGQSNEISHLNLTSAKPDTMVHENGDNIFPGFQKATPEPKQVQHEQNQDQAGSIKPDQLKQHDVSHYSDKVGDTANPAFLNPGGINRSSEPESCLNGPSLSNCVTNAKEEYPLEEVTRNEGTTSEPESYKTTETTSIAVDLTDPSELKKLLETLHNRGVLKEFGYKKGEASQGLEEPKLESVSGSSRYHAHACSKCEKTFPRKCELKKHEKRHQKPYGCTYQGCNKKFGSKNDWKRHENSQHFMLEVWRCDEKQKENPTETCGKNMQRKEGFRAHLQTHHEIKDPRVLESKLETCHIGRNCETRFWCGFCATTVEINQKGLKAWTERFNHIDDHFSGRNNKDQKDIGDWKNVDPSRPREDSTTLDSDDSSDSTSPPPLDSATTTTKQRKQIAHSSKQKRKRNDRCSEGSSKRSRRAVKTPLYHYCCNCREQVPIVSQQCLCEHKICSNCTYSLG